MKITAREEYGLRCLLQLARHASEPRPVTVRQVAAGEGLSFAYAEKLLRVLSAAGLAESIRGSRGGYRLLRTPQDITVGDAVRALGGFSSQQQICTRYTGNEETCVHQGDCTIRPLWGVVHREVERVLDAVTLNELLQPTPAPHQNSIVPLSSIQLEGGSR